MRLMQIMTRTVAGVLLLYASLAGAQTTPVFQFARTTQLGGMGEGDAVAGALALIDVGALDGIPDALTIAESKPLAVIVFGKGDGTFKSGTWSVDLQVIPRAFAAGKIDAGAQPDLLVAAQDGSLAYFRGLDQEPWFDRQTDPPSLPQFQAKALTLAKVDNGDTLDALVVGGGTDGGLAVLLGDGTGQFTAQPVVQTEAGAASTAIAVGQFNTDGKLDAAVLNPDKATVTILHQNATGNGVFTKVQTVSLKIGQQAAVPIAIASGELTGDQRPDLVISDAVNDRVLLLRGRSDGKFDDPVPFSSGTPLSQPGDLKLADVGCFDGCQPGTSTDNHLDVVLANFFTSDVSVLLGDGHGQFAAPRQFVADQQAEAVATADMNQDGVDDVVAVCQGIGTPTAAMMVTTSGRPAAVENVAAHIPANVGTGDLDDDGVADLVVAQATQVTGRALVVPYRSAGLAGFAQIPGVALDPEGDAAGLGFGDLNNDGWLDVVAVNGSGARTADVAVFLGRPSGGFTAAPPLQVGAPATAVAVGDWNLDGNLDLAVAVQPANGTGEIALLRGDGEGSFSLVDEVAVGQNPKAVDVGYFDKDGVLDLVVTNEGINPATGSASILLGDRVGFGLGTTVPSLAFPSTVAVADFDRDGSDDFAVLTRLQTGAVVRLLFGDGTGKAFVAGPQTLSVSGVAYPFAVRDVTGDLLPDVLIPDNTGNSLTLWRKSASPSQPRRFTQSASADVVRMSRQPVSVVAADFTGNGGYDAAVPSAFSPVVGVATNINPTPALRGDGNGDGSVTVADTLAVLRQLPEARYTRAEDAKCPGDPQKPCPGLDGNGDGIVTPLDARAVAGRLFASA